jgi:hypothetical protein
MRAWVLLLAVLGITAGPAATPGLWAAAPDVKALKGRTIPGFTLKRTTAAPNRVVELWARAADGAQLRIEIIPRADAAIAEARLKAVNAKIPREEPQSEELMFRFQTTADTKAWTNYRATHHITFKTYRFWRLQNRTLVMADVSFPRGKPSFDAARGAFVAAKKAADGTMQSLIGGRRTGLADGA